MAYDIIPIKVSDRDGTNKHTPVAGVITNGLKFDNTTGDVIIHFYNSGVGAVVLAITNNPNIETVVDGMVVADKPIASVAIGEAVELGPFLNSEYGNDDPDAGALPDGKTVIIEYTSGDGGVFSAIRRGNA